MSFRNFRVSYVEEQAVKRLLEKFSANENRLMKEFLAKDTNKTGQLLVNDWCAIVTRVLELKLPWRTLKSRLVDINSNGMVLYESTFRLQELQCALNSSPTAVEKKSCLFSSNKRSFLFFLLAKTKSLSSHL